MALRPFVRQFKANVLPMGVFFEILYWGILLQFVKRMEVFLKSDKNNGHFT